MSVPGKQNWRAAQSTKDRDIIENKTPNKILLLSDLLQLNIWQRLKKSNVSLITDSVAVDYSLIDGYLGEEVFVGACRVMQPLDQQSEELFDGQTQASDLVGTPAGAAFWDITQALAIGVQSSICLWNKEPQSNTHSVTCSNF